MASTGDEELLAEMRAALAEVQKESSRARRRVRRSRTTVRDKQRLLSVTVGGTGELRELTFHGDAYRDLAPAELANLIVTTANQARDEARRKAMAGFTELSGPVSELDDTARSAGSVDELVEGIIDLVSPADERRGRTRT